MSHVHEGDFFSFNSLKNYVNNGDSGIIESRQGESSDFTIRVQSTLFDFF